MANAPRLPYGLKVALIIVGLLLFLLAVSPAGQGHLGC